VQFARFELPASIGCLGGYHAGIDPPSSILTLVTAIGLVSFIPSWKYFKLKKDQKY